MICPQTTHLAVLLSLFDFREYVTALRAPQRGQKKLRPSVIGPIRGMAASGDYSGEGYAFRSVTANQLNDD